MIWRIIYIFTLFLMPIYFISAIWTNDIFKMIMLPAIWILALFGLLYVDDKNRKGVYL